MPYTIDYLSTEGVVVIENSGVLTDEDFARQGREAIELGLKNESRRFLADCASSFAQATTLGILNLPTLYESIGAPRDIKIAVVLSSDAATNKEIGFYETVCLNRGWNVKLFPRRNDAMDWLRGNVRA